MQLDHVAIAVRSHQAARPLYIAMLGAEPTHEETVEQEGVKILFFTAGATHLELLEPLSSSSPVWRFIEKHGEGLHHLGYLVADLDATLKRLAQQGLQPHGGIRAGSRGTRICFFHPRDTQGVLWELIEHKKS